MKYKCIKTIDLAFFTNPICVKGDICNLEKSPRGFRLKNHNGWPSILIFDDEVKKHFRKINIFDKIRVL